MKSTHPKYGWGPENGYVYQKAYFEMFIHPALVKPLIEYLSKFEDITYQAVNYQGEKHQNVADNDVNAVTWGVFKGREVIQPTVVDHQAFMIWKNEALSAFVETWGSIYKAQKGKDGKVVEADEESITFLRQCRDSFFLVNIVDNNYIDGDLSNIMVKFIEQHKDVIN